MLSLAGVRSQLGGVCEMDGEVGNLAWEAWFGLLSAESINNLSPELLFQRCLELGASRNSFEGNLRAGARVPRLYLRLQTTVSPRERQQTMWYSERNASQAQGIMFVPPQAPPSQGLHPDKELEAE
eukprot:g41.t1